MGRGASGSPESVRNSPKSPVNPADAALETEWGMNAPSERRLPVGRGMFDPLSGELSLDGRSVRLRPRTAALLSYLVQHPDRPAMTNSCKRSGPMWW